MSPPERSRTAAIPSSVIIVVSPSEQSSRISPLFIVTAWTSTSRSARPPRARVTTLRRGWLRACSGEITPVWICSLTQEWSLVRSVISPSAQR